ncbi:hypothetical protein [Amphritea pacifica]|uniref:hypothetical protein n=1 Tax=Amphritea pacifica TaxID=2811233 RepID=UPI0019647F1B|nr:hypothetical protein [Amphritea pacifica]MBN1008057.1 hypothetical protein [Amphritea pacifica]
MVVSFVGAASSGDIGCRHWAESLQDAAPTVKPAIQLCNDSDDLTAVVGAASSGNVCAGE